MEYIRRTQRLGLRPMMLEDSALIVQWRNQDWVREHYIYRELFTLEGQQAYYHSKVETGLVTQFIVCELGTDRPIGCTVLNDYERHDGHGEYGMFLGVKDVAGKGYSGEMVRMTLDYGFTELGLTEIISRIFVDNIPSIKGCNRGGMASAEILRDVECSDGTIKDMQIVRARKDDFYREMYIQNKLISYVIPCYYSERTLEAVVREIDAAMVGQPYRYEIVMVNDGCTDGTWPLIQRLCKETDNRVGISFARNFGQHAALMAGIRRAQGDYIICLDDDGQTPAEDAPRLIAAIEAGADVAYASYAHKQHSGFRNLGSWMNERMCEVMLGKPRGLYVSSYFAMRRFIANEVVRYENSYPYLLGLVLRCTQNIVNVPVNHRAREIGTSGYTLGKLFALWMNGFTAFSVKPLRIATTIGACSAVLGFLYGIYTIIKKLINPEVPMGFSAMMTAVIFFGGMIMLMLGLAGEYVGRTYIAVNKAPQYLIRETTDEEM